MNAFNCPHLAAMKLTVPDVSISEVDNSNVSRILDVASFVKILDHGMRYPFPFDGCPRGCYIQDCVHGAVPLFRHYV